MSNIKIININQYIKESKGNGKISIEKIDTKKLNKQNTLKKKLEEYAKSILLDEITDKHIRQIIMKKPQNIKDMTEINLNLSQKTLEDIIEIVKQNYE